MLKGRRGAITDPNAGVSWKEALDQVKKGRMRGPYRFDEEGRLAAADGPQLANPAFRYGAHGGGD